MLYFICKYISILNLFIRLVSRINTLYLSIQLNNINKKMPQLIPFYFVNEVTFAFGIIVILVYLLSKYILPVFVRLNVIRTFLTKIY